MIHLLYKLWVNIPIYAQDNDKFPYLIDALSVTVDSTFSTSLKISWELDHRMTPASYNISYSNTNTDCFTDSSDFTGIAANETMYTLTDLQENTEYSITVTTFLDAAGNNIMATTTAAG